MSNHPIIMTVETDVGTYIYGFHLGTDEKLARQMAEEFFHKARPKMGSRIKVVAISASDFPADYYDGVRWMSEAVAIHIAENEFASGMFSLH